MRSTRCSPARREAIGSWKLKAFKYYYIPSPPIVLAGMVVEQTEDLLRFQQKIIDAVTPFTEKTGTPAAFMSTEDGKDIQGSLIEYVANFAGQSQQARNSTRMSQLGLVPKSF